MRLPLLFLLSVFSTGDAYKILVYNSRFGHSHSNFMGSIADILVDAGHNVTSLIPIIEEEKSDGTTKSTIIHVQPFEGGGVFMKEAEKTLDIFGMRHMDFFGNVFAGPVIGNVFAKQCRKTLEEPGLIERLKAENYDVMLTENFDMCGTGISLIIKPKAFIAVSTTMLFGAQYEQIGVPVMPSFNPSMYSSHIDVHSMVSRAWNIVGELLGRTMFYNFRQLVHNVFTEKYGTDFPSWVEITSHAACAFTNSEPLIDYAHPTLHRVIDIGGLGAKEPKKLDKHWEEVLTRRSRNVLLSFGSTARSTALKSEVKTAVLEMIRAFPSVTFIWKYEEPEDEFATNEASKVANLVLTKWMPQNDLLGHPKLTAFITHGGMGSVQETAVRGVPAIFIPLGAEQPRNAAMMEHNGFGIVYDKFELGDASKLADVVKEILENESYRINAKRVSGMLAKKPFSSKELLIKHVEFAAEFGPSPALRPASQDMHFIEYFNLDIIAVAFCILLAFVYIFIVIIRKIVGRCTRSVHVKQKRS